MIKPLTSLRFFFALLVFCSHLPSSPEVELGMALFFKNLTSRGGVGVSFFFVLSGFVISYAYFGKIKKTKQIIRFYWNRIVRIWPMHLITLALSIPLVIYQYGTLPKKAGVMNLLLLQSASTSKSIYFSYNAPSWSISTEMAFYFLTPLIFLFLSQILKPSKRSIYVKISLVLLSLVILLFSLILFTENSHYHSIFYISPLCRIADFVLGCLVYLVWKRIGDLTDFQNKSRLFCNFDILALLVFFIFYTMDAFLDFIPIPYRYFLYYWLPMALVIFAFALPKGRIV